jgi:hypothetical protein
MKPYQIIVFDLDGTLLDTSEGLLAAFRETLKKCRLEVPAESVLRESIGPPFHQFLRRRYPALPEEEVLRINDLFRGIYAQDDYLFRAVPYDGIFDLWATLQAQKTVLAVATNKREDYARRLLIHMGFGRYTPYMYGTDFQNTLKKADVIRHCLFQSGINAEQALVVGDSSSDAYGAEALGIDFVGALYGFGFASEEEILKFDRVKGCIMTPRELLSVISGSPNKNRLTIKSQAQNAEER